MDFPPPTLEQTAPHTLAQNREALRRLNLLREVAALMATGYSQNRAARELGVSSANLTRWRQAYEGKWDGRVGYAALIPKKSTGRPCGLERGNRK